ncbi:17684_t:CDS:2 [Funneliformis geosporum]|uniref:11463_t:CDS:1 n=1 Tax=Funneliformis geosporum TaxID=1117311 RepID=A0A9W4WS78_9GLOM|nr:17684_t:CDS:2 [Funneliformis geosporum]CAI2182921.1 11463_t:CDS:2 [Funneliformis geosporum]
MSQKASEAPKVLDPPKSTPFTPAELAKFDGSDPTIPVYVAVKSTVFDVSEKRNLYGLNGSYHVFAGKDASKGLGMSSLNLEDAVADYSTLDESQLKVLDDWYDRFSKQYNIVGKVVS